MRVILTFYRVSLIKGTWVQLSLAQLQVNGVTDQEIAERLKVLNDESDPNSNIKRANGLAPSSLPDNRRNY